MPFVFKWLSSTGRGGTIMGSDENFPGPDDRHSAMNARIVAKLSSTTASWSRPLIVVVTVVLVVELVVLSVASIVVSKTIVWDRGGVSVCVMTSVCDVVAGSVSG